MNQLDRRRFFKLEHEDKVRRLRAKQSNNVKRFFEKAAREERFKNMQVADVAKDFSITGDKE